MSPRVRTASSLTVTDEMLQRADVRSCWTLGKTNVAARAVAMAMAHLPQLARKMRERKRKRGEGNVNCVLLDQANRYDYAVLEEIERAELWQEHHGHRLTQEELTKRFVKPPIKFALNHNGYYAAIAKCLGFAEYTCGEVSKLYHYASLDRLTSKADRERDRVSEPLFECLYQRFGHVAALEPCSNPLDTPRLRREAPTPQLLACLRKGLALHVPWVARPVILPRSTRDNPAFSADPDEAEMQRIRLFLDSASFDQLTALLGVASFDDRARTIILRTDPLLAEPEPEPEDNDARLARIRALMDDEIDRMQSARPGALRIRVDGIERARMDDAGQSAPMLLEAHASLVEIVADAADSTEVVVGSYLLTYDGEKDEEWELELPWSDRDRLICSFDYAADDCVNATFERRRRATARVHASASVPVACNLYTRGSEPLDHPLFQPGNVVADSYEIVAYLGRGSLGMTYQAYEVATSRPVALKAMVLGECGSGKSSMLASFVRALEREPHHPIVADIQDVRDYDDGVFIVQEFVEGTSLRDRLLDAPMSTARVFECMEKILASVGELHRCELVHRDIKPSNIMFCSEGMKILDFGIARSLDRAQRWDLRDVSYMAPDTLYDSHADARADVFSIGVMAYEMLTGARPLDRVPPAEIDPCLPADLSDVVMRACSLDPDDRYPNANALHDAWVRCSESVHRSTAEAARYDRELVARFGTGDTAALQALVERCEALLRRTLLRRDALPPDHESRANQVWTWLMFDGRRGDAPEIGERLWRDARRASCLASPDLLVQTVDRLVLLECKAALEMLTAGDDRTAARAAETFERHRSELAWLTRRHRDDLLFESVNRHCFTPQDWRAVVPVARRLAVGARREGASEDWIRDAIAASDRLLPRLKLRPSLAAVLAILLQEPGTSG